MRVTATEAKNLFGKSCALATHKPVFIERPKALFSCAAF